MSNKLEKTINVQLTLDQIEVLRGVLYEYYSQNAAYNKKEEQVRQQLENILADAEDAIYS
jgi:predicted DNA-binding protein (UPF0251 family)